MEVSVEQESTSTTELPTNAGSGEDISTRKETAAAITEISPNSTRVTNPLLDHQEPYIYEKPPKEVASTTVDSLKHMPSLQHSVNSQADEILDESLEGTLWGRTPHSYAEISTNIQSVREFTDVTSTSSPYTSSETIDRNMDTEDIPSVSADTVRMTTEENMEVITDVTNALYDGIRDPEFSRVSPSSAFNTLLTTSIKRFSESVKNDNPRGGRELKTRRRVAKAIYRLRSQISRGFDERVDQVRGVQVPHLPAIAEDESESEDSSEEFSERLLPDADIPQETMEQKMQRFHADDHKVIMSSPTEDEDHVLADSNASSPVLSARPDFSKLLSYFRMHPAFGDLILSTRRFMRHFRVNTLDYIEYSLSQTLGVSPSSPNNMPRKMEVVIHIGWDLFPFLEERKSVGLSDDLGSVLTITGNSNAAQMSTISQYFGQTWQEKTHVLLPAFQREVSGHNSECERFTSLVSLPCPNYDLSLPSIRT